MKKELLSLVVVIMGSMVMMPDVDAQSRRGGRESNRSSQTQRVTSSRSGSDNDKKATVRPGSTSNNRPSSGSSVRPGSSSNNRPGSSSGVGGGSSVRPEQGSSRPNQGSVSRPGNSGNNKPDKPGNNMGHKPNKPNYNSGPRPNVVAPPPRPGRPIYDTPWCKPVPPTNWRPVNQRSLLSDVLGLVFGVSINSALDYLWGNGYVVDGYGTQEVYLRNVNEMGYNWDEATMYFSGNGLVRSQFYDSSISYNTSRFDNVYRKLCNQYGSPVNYNGQSATWFGCNGDYITLEYTRMNTSSGYRYFTILTYGN